MMTLHSIVKFILGHVLAGVVIILGTILITIACYVVELSKAPGGIDTPVAVIPEFLTLIFTVGVFAIGVSTASFIISTLLVWLRSKRYFPVWLPVLCVPLIACVITYLIRGRNDPGFVVVVTTSAFMYFGIYWTLLMSSAAVLDFMRRKFSSQTPRQNPS